MSSAGRCAYRYEAQGISEEQVLLSEPHNDRVEQARSSFQFGVVDFGDVDVTATLAALKN